MESDGAADEDVNKDTSDIDGPEETQNYLEKVLRGCGVVQAGSDMREIDQKYFFDMKLLAESQHVIYRDHGLCGIDLWDAMVKFRRCPRVPFDEFGVSLRD